MPFTLAIDALLAGALAGALLAGLVTWLILRRGRATAVALALADQRDAIVEARLLLAQRETQLSELQEEFAALAAARRELEAELRDARESETRSRARLDALGEMDRSREALAATFETVARRVLEERGRGLNEAQARQLDGMLTPLREQLGEFRRRIDDVHTEQTRERSALLGELRNMQQATEGINREARGLAEALKGDVKQQGNWGELVLERVLESSGLRAGHEYVTQPAYRNDEGDLKRPDVVVRLPEGREVVVDAKVSLVNWERARASNDEAETRRLLRQHAQDVRAQVQRLAEQHYAELPGLTSPDLVLLFLPVEAALAAALEAQPDLLTQGFEQRVVLVGPSTLMLSLRLVGQLWRRDRQHRHAEEIARQAAALHDRLQASVDDLERMGRQIAALEKTWQSGLRRLATGRGSALAQARRFLALGAGDPDADADSEAEADSRSEADSQAEIEAGTAREGIPAAGGPDPQTSGD